MYDYLSFRLPEKFVESYANTKPPFGYPIGAGNSLGELTYLSKYSRRLDDGSKERWFQTCERVINGMYSILKDHCATNRTPWNTAKANKSAQNAYDRMFSMKFLPPGRGIWMMGTALVNEKRNSGALQNCSFLTTGNLSAHSKYDATHPFTRLMEMSMMGVGVGFDTRGAGKLKIHAPSSPNIIYEIEDSREGWVESVRRLLQSYLFPNQKGNTFIYDKIRPAGQPVKGFGGTAAGPGPLIALHDSLNEILSGRDGQSITSTDIVDIMNLIGKCLPGDTWILTVAGPRQIKDLVGVNIPLIIDGKIYEMESDGFFQTGTKPLVEINTRQGWNLKATNDHLIKLIDGSWIAAGSLNIGDKILLHEHTNISWEGKGTEIEGYALGHLVGDGHIRANAWGELAQLMSWDQDLGSEDCRKVLYDCVSSLPHRVDWRGWNYNGPEGRQVCSSQGLTRLAAEYGIVRGNKKVTTEVELASSDFNIGFLRGLFDADGSVNASTRSITLSQSDYSLLIRVQRMLARLGIISTVRKLSRGLECVLYIGGIDAQNYMERIGFVNTLKTSKYYTYARTRNTYRRTPHATVTSIVDCGEEPVYDVSVKDIHAFDANGMYVHNCVVSGGIRRTAEIALGEADDKEFLNLKNWEVNPVRNGPNGWGHTSNNSVFAEVGGNYDHLIPGIVSNGEPGMMYLDLARSHGRLVDSPNNADYRVTGMNPCGEMPLESEECCTLCEVYLTNNDSKEDFLETVKIAYLYGKAVTLLATSWPETNEVMQRNRRVGCSVSGSAEFAELHSWSELSSWLNAGYDLIQHRDRKYSEWLGIRESIKTTTVKPSGTTSLICGSTPGVHWPVDNIYIRRMRLNNVDPLVEVLRQAGYPVEPDVMNPMFDSVVELPVRGPSIRSEKQVSIWEKAALAVMHQRFWADNQVSCTVTFDPVTEGDQIGAILRAFDGQLKSISFLPMHDGGAYQQMPYESISEEEYLERSDNVLGLDWDRLYHGDSLDAVGESFCTTDVCELKK